MNLYGNLSRRIAGFVERNFLEGSSLDSNSQSLTKVETARKLSENKDTLIRQAIDATSKEFDDAQVAVDRNALYRDIESSLQFAIKYLEDSSNLPQNELKLSSRVPFEAYREALSYISYSIAPQLSESAIKTLDQAFDSLISAVRSS